MKLFHHCLYSERAPSLLALQQPCPQCGLRNNGKCACAIRLTRPAGTWRCVRTVMPSGQECSTVRTQVAPALHSSQRSCRPLTAGVSNTSARH